MEEAWEKDTEFLISLGEELTASIDPAFHFSRDRSTLVADDLEEDIKKAERLILSRYPYFSLTPSLYALRKMEKEQGLGLYLEDGRLYGALFYLAHSLYHEGFNRQADEVWKLVCFSSATLPGKH